ncbi:DUF5723 family protein [Aliifodinibius sp. S!AR15-10]|uniref:DUF5723 family protein n=1 Tax=Aliifodinibius sp. S!AR15-10 TaxID=2950437 RepID=UPI0028646A1D|nr:DUF5723 family protein [Aliifodinibius sp. S!AR15-10]MDR8391840.1 DUF5723 family protein [Aliifodinibius sp. S!AR15-10]
MKRFTNFSALLLAFVMISGSVFAQSRHVSGTSLGLGGGGTAYLNGYHANFVNPANLMLQNNTENNFTIGLLGGISTSGGGSLANIAVYNEYFTKGLSITDEVAVEALDKWFGNPQNMKTAGFQLDAIPIGISSRGENWSASLALRSRTMTNIGANRGLAELYIYGLDGEIFSPERPVNMSVEGMSFAEVSAGYSTKIIEIPNILGVFRDIEIFVGAAPKLLLGTNYSRFDFKSTLQIQRSDNYIDELRHDFNYTLETTGEISDQLNQYYNDRQNSSENPSLDDYVDPEAADFIGIKGTGFGLDLGVTAQMKLNLPILGAISKGEERLRVGVSITDIGSINFDQKYGRFTADDVVVWDGFKIDQEKIDNEYNGDEGEYYNDVLADSIGSGIYGGFDPAGDQSVSKSLPSMINLGAQLTMGKLSFSMDLGKGFDDQGINSKRVSLATGLEYRLLGFLPLRVGMRTGGYSSTTYTAGVGLNFNFFEFNVAAASVSDSMSNGTNVGAAWSGLVFRF